MASTLSCHEFSPFTDERYARSLSTLERVGALAVTGALETDKSGVVGLLYEDFETGVLENLRTAEGVETYLDIERERWYRMVDGQATAADGTPMIDIIMRGYKNAEAAARHDPQMERQAHRDEGDCLIAQAADALRPGQLLMAVSLPPLEGLANDEQFWRGLGYRRDLAYVQTYYMTDNGEAMIAGSFSVGTCDADAWREVLASYGISVPVFASADDFIRHFAVKNVSADQAQAFGRQVRERYYQAVGEARHRQSVTEYLAAQEQVVGQYFDRYMLSLAKAVHTGQNTPELQELALAILDTDAISQFKSELFDQIMHVATEPEFPRSAGAVMENLIRYALVERLRGGLIAVVGGVDIGSVRIGEAWTVAPEMLHVQLARDIASGVQAGRNYGGCASLTLNQESSAAQATAQEAYGGRGEGSRETWKWTRGECRVKNCPSPKPTEVGPCSVCRRCQHLFDLGRDPTGGSSEQAGKRTDYAAAIIQTLRGKTATKQLAAESSPELGFGGLLLAA